MTMPLDRIKAPLAAFVRAAVPQIDFLAAYPGQVVNQRGPNSFDIQPDDPRMPGCSGIPIKLPFPGFSLTLDTSKSPRAMLAFANGSPSSPEIHLWEAPGAAVIEIDATTLKLNGGGQGCARNGDSVKVTITPADILALGLSAATGGPVSAANAADVDGNITQGSSSVQVGG